MHIRNGDNCLVSLVQDLVSKNEALRRQLHELQVHTEQQLQKKDAAFQTQEQHRLHGYQKEIQAAKQLNVDAMASPAVYILFCHAASAFQSATLRHFCRI